MYSDLPLTLYVCFVLAFLGAVMGSFFYCMADRIINGESITKGRSHCNVCGHVLGPLDLVPVFSWLFLKGKCRYCGAPVPARYPLSEAVSAAVYVLTFLRFGWSLQTIEFLLLDSVLMCICFTDIEDYLVPDRFILAGIAVRIIFALTEAEPAKALLRSLTGGLSVSLPVLVIVLATEKILKKDAMGGGDIKLLFMTGLYFSWQVNLFSLILACIAGILTGVLIKESRNEEGQFPFGPSIALAAFISMLCGTQAVDWYLSLL